MCSKEVENIFNTHLKHSTFIYIYHYYFLFLENNY